MVTTPGFVFMVTLEGLNSTTSSYGATARRQVNNKFPEIPCTHLIDLGKMKG